MQVLKGHLHDKPVRSLAFSPDGTRLASCARDYLSRLWDLGTGRSVVVSGEGWGAHSVAYSPDGSTVLTRKYHSLTRWGVASGSASTIMTEHTGGAVAVAYSPDGRLVASAGTELQLWDTATWKQLPPWPPRDRATGCLAWSPDGKTLACGHHEVSGGRREYVVRLWDVAGGRERTILRGSTATPAALAFSPDGRIVAAACGQTLWAWDAVTREPLLCHRVGQQHYKDAAFTPDGRFLAVARNDRTVRLLDARTWGEAAAFDWEIGPIVTVAVAPDGMRAAAGGTGKIVVWDLD